MTHAFSFSITLVNQFECTFLKVTILAKNSQIRVKKLTIDEEDNGIK